MKRRDFIKVCGLGCVVCCGRPLSVYASPLQEQTYSTRRLLRQYDQKADDRRQLYLPLFGADRIDTVLDEMRDSYEALIPDIPYIGRINFHLQWAIPNAEKLAEYLVAQAYGVSIPEFSRLHLEKAESDLMEMPEEQRERIGSMQFGPLPETQMRLRAWRSQLLIYPEDYIFTFVKGDGVEFDWGLNYTQCPNLILYSRHGAADLVYPLICTMDYVAGKALKTGYYRTMDLATGGEMCDLRWKEGVESEVPDI